MSEGINAKSYIGLVTSISTNYDVLFYGDDN